MSKSETVDYIYIDSNLSLNKQIGKINSVQHLSVDLEFDKNRFRYGFNLCLIQIYDGDQTYLVDPLSEEIDLSPLFKVFEDPDITKIVFSFGEDLRLLHSLGCFPQGLFDLQIVSGLLNFPPSSLASLIDQVLGIYISKSSQQSNWFNRPLSIAQLNYAVQDVIFLPKIYALFQSQSDKRGIESWIQQEMTHFESDNHEDASQNEILKEKYKGDLNEIEWHLFSRLMLLREAHAEKMNRPPYHIAERRILNQIARNPEFSSEWMRISSNHRSTKNLSFVHLLESEIEVALSESKELGLSSRRRAAKKLSKDEYEEWKAIEMKVKYAKQNFFKPIQKCIDQEFGEHVKTLILNNRLIKDLVVGKHANLLPYKRKVIIDCANKLGLNSDPYLTNSTEL